MAKRPQHDPTNSGTDNRSKGGGRGGALTHNMFDKYDTRQRSRDNQNQPKQRELGIGTYRAWLFDLGDKERPQPELVEGVPLLRHEDDEVYIKVHYTLPPEATGEQRNKLIVEEVSLTQWFAKKQRKYEMDGDTLVSADLPLTTHDGKAGVMLFIRPPGSCGIRVHKDPNENPPLTSDELRIATCYIEKRYSEEADREAAKKSLPKDACFHFPGHDGEGLMSRGIRVAYPLFKNKDARRLKRPHEHIVLLQKGRLIKKNNLEISVPTRFEIMCQFRKDQKVPNWYEIQVDHEGEISVINIRDEKHSWMPAALTRLKTELDEEARRVEDNLQGI